MRHKWESTLSGDVPQVRI